MSPELVKSAVIVEDDPAIRHVLSEVFEAAGFSTVSVGNGLDGVRAVVSYQPMVTTLDVNMPGIDGLEAARRIRQQSDTYIIMLTGMESETDVVLGLSAGADEYLTKPFRPRELRARIEAIVRRRQAAPTASASAAYGAPPVPQPQQDAVGPSFPARPAAPPPDYDDDDRVGRGHPPFSTAHPSAPAPGPARPAPSDTPVTLVVSERQAEGDDPAVSAELVSIDDGVWLHHRDLRLSVDSHLVARGDRDIPLTPTEFDLLAALMQSKRRVRSKSDLTLVLRGESYVTSYFVGEADKRAIEAHMTNLRRKLGDDASTPRYIETVRGVGYRMTSETPPA